MFKIPGRDCLGFSYQSNNPDLIHVFHIPQAINKEGKVVGAIVCKMENSKSSPSRAETVRRGYIAMLAVDKTIRRVKIGMSQVENNSLVREGVVVHIAKTVRWL